ncbi:endonuclease/exonuclease/phosphatase family protein [Paroceanicella profunda]|uniref:endonuclease/exonuclease/phosphatase family protein n=1 Tax=Paroceanicella profunda TaxID=2579971 RepID=UPI001EF12B05|nr:endonuclease/exonuclease/phosphatase family protein [Paroceanicella profunda]
MAVYNVALSRRGAGVLWRDLDRVRDGRGDAQIEALLQVIPRLGADVLVLTEFDHDPEGQALGAFTALLQAPPGADAPAIAYPHRFAGPVNSGQPSGIDLDGDGRTDGRADAWGFGAFPGQKGMAVLSRFPLGPVTGFRGLRWRALPGHHLPLREDGTPFPSEAAQAAMRLSSRAHWVVPVQLPGGVAELLVSHASAPVFDDAHDLNGRRNADEIRFWQLWLDGTGFRADSGETVVRGPAPVLLAGTLNADPFDGAGAQEAIAALLAHPALQDPGPEGPGGVAAAGQGANAAHRGPPARDTADFRDTPAPGNLRVDYLLPDARFTVTASGVWWPAEGEEAALLAAASDHRPVWVDLKPPAP